MSLEPPLSSPLVSSQARSPADKQTMMASHLKPHPNITLYRGFQASAVYAWSPFFTKLEARLRFAGLPYRAEPGSLAKAPRGKIPYVAISKTESTTTPTVLGDTTAIIQTFVEDGLLLDLNAKLSPTEKAHDLATRALLEEKLYFYQVSVLLLRSSSPPPLPPLKYKATTN